MNNKIIFLLSIVIFSCLMPDKASAFDCTPGGLSAAVPVAPPILKRNTYDIVTLGDLSTSVICNGNYMDNLRVYSVSIHPKLAEFGFSAVLNIDGSRFDIPTSGQYIWPYPNSSAAILASEGYKVFPLKVAVELRRDAAGEWVTGLTLPAGTVIATLAAEQRSWSYWTLNQYWNLTLTAPLVIPAHTCNVTNPANRTITLPDADATLLRGVGKGIFTNSKTRFTLDLDCQEMSIVDLSFSGTTMSGKDDVLANQASGSSNIGIQIFPADSTTAIKFDNVENRVIDAAAATETLEYDAYYYVAGGRVVQPGQVKATMIYTFTYK